MLQQIATLVLCSLLLGACGGSKVPRLSPRDARLPSEAARWLADAEDQVEIARARVDDAEKELKNNRHYARSLEGRVASMGPLVPQADVVSRERVTLAERELRAARRTLSLAQARLTLTRAETAMRHDLAVYELEPIVEEFEFHKDRVAEAEREVEEQRSAVEQASDTMWRAYGEYVRGGNSSNELWGAP